MKEVFDAHSPCPFFATFNPYPPRFLFGWLIHTYPGTRVLRINVYVHMYNVYATAGYNVVNSAEKKTKRRKKVLYDLEMFTSYRAYHPNFCEGKESHFTGSNPVNASGTEPWGAVGSNRQGCFWKRKLCIFFTVRYAGFEPVTTALTQRYFTPINTSRIRMKRLIWTNCSIIFSILCYMGGGTCHVLC